MIIVGDYDNPNKPATITFEDLQSRLDAALQSTAYTTDPRDLYADELCQKLVGFKVYTNAKFSYELPEFSYKVGGHTVCWARAITVGTPYDKNWRRSSLVHEIYHVWQNCEFMPDGGTPDRPNDIQHYNWERYGIYPAIELARDM